MQLTDGDLIPAERFREIVAILAAGILRLKIRPEPLPDPADSGPKNGPEKLSDSAQE